VSRTGWDRDQKVRARNEDARANNPVNNVIMTAKKEGLQLLCIAGKENREPPQVQSEV
jgi:hypothetical protein